MTSEEWLAEQRRVWGDVNGAFGAVAERLQYGEARLIRTAAEARPEEAASLVDSILGVMSPASSPAPTAALGRFGVLRPAVIERVASALRKGVVPHGIIWIVANAFLRGDMDAVEEKLPPGLRALSCEEWAREEAVS